MKKFTLMLFAAFMAVLSYAQTEQSKATWVAAEQGYENAQDVTAFDIDENVSAFVEQNDGNNAAKYYTGGEALRVYDLNSFTIIAGSKVKQLDKIVLNFVSESYNGYLSTDVETYTVDGATGTWEGVANDVTFINDKTSAGATSNKQARIVSIDVYYTLAEESEQPEPMDDYNIDPEGTVQTSLSEFTLTFNNYLVEVAEDADKPILFNTVTEEEVTATFFSDIAGSKKVRIVFPEVTAPGDYALIIPDGTIQKTIDGSFLPELEFNYTIVGAAGPDITIDPAEGEVKSIGYVNISFNNYYIELIDEDAAQAVLFNEETEEEVYSPIYESGGNKLILMFDEVTAPGQYTLFIPDGTLRKSIDGTVLGDLDFHYTIVDSDPADPTLVELPEDAVAENWQFQAFDPYYEATVTRPVQVAFVGTDVYLNGVTSELPDAWIKGVLNGDKVTFAANQYLGSFYYGMAEMFFNPAGDVVFDYDAEKNVLSTATYVTKYGDGEYIYDEFTDVVITKVLEKAGTPANPTLVSVNFDDWGDYLVAEVPSSDVDGNPMVADKLSYQFYVEDASGSVAPLTLEAGVYYYLTENMVEIPYLFTDNYDILIVNESRYIYLNQGADVISSWNKIGVKSIYRGGGETHESEIGWFDIQESLVGTGIDAVSTDAEVKYFDLQGRVADASSKGLVIKQVRDAQGNVRNIKVMR